MDLKAIPRWVFVGVMASLVILLTASYVRKRPFILHGQPWGFSEAPVFQTASFQIEGRETDQILPLGDHQLCTLSKSGMLHPGQACYCEVRRTTNEKDSEWLLELSIDENIRGKQCACAAVCVN